MFRKAVFAALVLVVAHPAIAQDMDRWGLTAADWRTLPGPVFREKIHARDRREEIEREARNGDLGAIAIAAGALSDTTWGKPDYAAAYGYAKAAADRGEPRAMVSAGSLLLAGTGVAQDKAAAFGWFLKSAQLGQVQGMLNAGALLEQGSGTAKDEAAAVEWYRRAAALNDPTACYYLATSLWKGAGMAKDIPTAFATMRRAAEGGSPDGMFWYGVWLDDPAINPGPPDRERSTAWIGRAAEAGLPDGIYYYGVRLRTGHGIAANPAAGAAWLQRGADAGDQRSKFALAYALSDPASGVAQDPARAMQLYREIAADPRSTPAQMGSAFYNLGTIFEAAGNIAEARNQYGKAQAAGDADAPKAIANLDARQRDAAARAQQQAAADAAARSRAAADAAARAAAAIGPSDAEISQLFARYGAKNSKWLQATRDGALIVKNQFNAEIFRATILIRDRRCAKLSATSYRCSYTLVPRLSSGTDGSLSASVMDLSNSFADAFLGPGRALKAKANKLNEILAQDQVARTDVFVRGKAGYESQSLSKFVWDNTLICMGECDPRL